MSLMHVGLEEKHSANNFNGVRLSMLHEPVDTVDTRTYPNKTLIVL